MDFENLLKERRSIRRFTDQKVDTDIIIEIIKDSLMAPNAGNEQPWKFTIVSDMEMMKRISDESKKNILERIRSTEGDSAKRYEGILKKENYNVFYNAPSLVIIYGDMDKRNILVDCALAASYFMFSASDKGLGTCWINLGAEIKDKEMRKDLNIGENDRIVSPVILGYPDQKPKAPVRKDPVIHIYG